MEIDVLSHVVLWTIPLAFKGSGNQGENRLFVLSDALGFPSCHCLEVRFLGALWNDQVDYLS